MAKRKHATALFEVIHSKKNSSKSLLSTPRWWFKKNDLRQSSGLSPKAGAIEATRQTAPVAAPVAVPTAEEIANDPTAGRDAVNHQIQAVPSATSRAARSPVQSHAQPYDAASTASAGGIGSSGSVGVAVDRDRQQISFKFSYTSAIIVTFSLLVAVALAYIVGQKMSRGPSLAMGGQTSEQLRAGPKNPAVLDVGQRHPTAPAQREPETGISSRGPENNPDNVEQPAGTNANVNQADPNQPPKRVVNLNYVVVQSYPDQKSAEEARDALIKAGLGATVERGLKGWTKDWYIVVGLQGFQRASGPDFDAYLKKIDQVSQQFSQRKRSFKTFQPMAFKWQPPT